MHADQGSADVEPCIRLDMLECDGGLEICVAGRRKGASCFGLWDDVYDFCVRDGFVFDDDSSIQVLAALRCDINALSSENALDTFIDGFSDLGNGMATDLVAQGFAGAATDDYDIAFFEMGCFDEFRSGFGGV